MGSIHSTAPLYQSDDGFGVAQVAGRVLVIGEDDLDRDALERVLGDQGFQVVGVKSPSALVYELVAHAHEIDVIVVDVSALAQDIRQLMTRIKSANPTAKVVLCSSPDAGSHIGHALCAGALAVIMKPFDPSQMTGLLNMAMERSISNDLVRCSPASDQTA
jgi:two-component system, chemotaxis family, chemotaxis protein CheY